MTEWLIGAGLTIFGIGFSVWAFKVDDARKALDRMSSSIKEVVELKLGGVAADVHEIKRDVKAMATDMHNHGADIAVLKERTKRGD